MAKPKSATERLDAIRDLRSKCESDLWTFARTVEPHRMYGDIHKKLFTWWQHEAGDNALALLPRDHQKSHCLAVLVAWLITKDPTITILYISATSYLAQQQLRDIKQIMTGKVYQLLWPEMLNPEEGKREKWTNTEICVDHPKRKEAGVRDSTIFTAGLTTNTTGLHAKVIAKDDVVVPDNAYTTEGRRSVSAACSQLASILTTGGREYVVGTRYHPKDHYNDLKEMYQDIFTDEGEVIDRQPVYNIMEHEVETSGRFLWPKMFSSDGESYGFDLKELSTKKAKYTDTLQFYAQYYNNPNDLENQRLSRDCFQYYNKEYLVERDGYITYKGDRLNIYAAIDFAFSLSTKADSTALIVIGVNPDGHIYILDIDRFKTNKVENYFQAILAMHSKWDFSKLRAEVTVAQSAVVEYIKDRIKDEGMVLSVEDYRPSKKEGSKEERIQAALEPRYDNREVWHYRGGYIDMLEEELINPNPKHDDLKDALASAVTMKLVRPRRKSSEDTSVVQMTTHPRFGGFGRV